MLILCVSFAVALLDQATKVIVRARLPGDPLRVIRGFFSLRYVQNTGAAWGMLEGLNDWLVGLSFVMLALIVIFRRSLLIDTLTHRLATGLMLGGIVGNLTDRLRLGYVVDFLDFHLRGRHFPAFNVADAAICVGVGLYLFTQFFGHAPEEKKLPATTSET
ncbi:MAG: signal peptidase II [Lentisphaerae bacterium]|nr:signal peptidase II [Lentisphaerota bacterium]